MSKSFISLDRPAQYHLYRLQQAGASGTGGWMEILTLGSLRPSGWCERTSKGQRGPKRARGWRDGTGQDGGGGWV